MGSEVRISQLLSPFAPGSIYTDKYGIPNIICGLDYWFVKQENGRLEEIPEAISINLIVEPRLTNILKVSTLRQPPKYIFDKDNIKLSGLKIHTHRFPRWYVNNTSGDLRRFNLESKKIEKGAWRPVRFIAVCEAGHISDFPWKEWLSCTCNNDMGLKLNDAGGVDLTSIKISCKNCNKWKSLAGATFINLENGESGLLKAGINCSGQRPWLGENCINEYCEKPLAAVLINQSNIYFAKTISSIFLPDLDADPLTKKIQDIITNSEKLSPASVMFKLGYKEMGIEIIKRIITEECGDLPLPSDETIIEAFENIGSGRSSSSPSPIPLTNDSVLLAFRRTEYNILRNSITEGISNELCVISSDVPSSLQKFFTKVNLIEKLRETRVFYGFDRLIRSENPLEGMPEVAIKQLFMKTPGSETWLPAVKNYGEGIYLELSELTIQKWLQNNSEWLQKRYTKNFVDRMSLETMLLPPSSNVDWKWASRYQLVHTLSHILINQLIYECGYSSASLRERLFVSSDEQAPMAGILIYTASGDSDGSLGGLVRMGRPELFENTVKKAINKSSWCSADPVCSENLGGGGSRLINMAACHACTLLPETTCETINNGLDRASIIGTPTDHERGFFSELLKYFN